MKISFVITSGPPLVGGLETLCLRLAQELGKSGHDASICARFTEERHSLADYFRVTQAGGVIECEGVKVEVLALDARAKLLLKPVFKLIWRPVTFPLARKLYVAALADKLRKACAGSDVVHYFGNAPEMLGFAALAAARRMGARFVVQPALHEGQWGDKWYDALLYKRADLVLAHSRHEAGVLHRMGVEASQVRTLALGFDACHSGDGNRFRSSRGIAGPIVLFLGRKTLPKGVGHLLDAWPAVAARFPEATLVIAGPRQTKAQRLADIERNSSGQLLTSSGAKILDLDDLTESDKQGALAACDLLCVPSKGESFGIVYFEAWAYGKPVVALDLPVLRETVGAAKAGILAQDTPTAISAAICHLLANPQERVTMGQRGAALASKHTWKATAEDCITAYASDDE